MGRNLGRPLAVEIRLAERLEAYRIDQIGIACHVPHGHQLAAMQDDVRIGGIFKGHVRPVGAAGVQHAAP